MKRIFHIFIGVTVLCAMYGLLNIASAAGVTVTFENIENGKNYYVNYLTSVGVSAQSTGGAVTKIELYIDGTLYKTSAASPGSFDLSGIPVTTKKIKAIAYDAAGNTGVSEFTVSLAEITTKASYSYNFDNMTEGNYADTYDFKECDGKLAGKSETGYYGVRTITEDRKKSLVVGIDTKNPASTAGAWIGTAVTTMPSTVMVTEDVYLDKLANFQLYLRGSSGSVTNVDAEFKSDGYLYLYNGSSKVTKLSYSPKRWYSIHYIINLTDKTFTFILDGVPAALSYSMKNQAFDQLTAVRVVAPNTDAVKCFMAVDNFAVSTVQVIPYIERISFDDSLTLAYVDHNASAINLHLSAAVNQQNVNLSKIVFSKPNYIKSVSYVDSKTIKLTLAYKLLSNTQYSVGIAAGTEIITGLVLSKPVTKSFTTSMADVEITESSFGTTQNTTVFQCSLTNTAANDKTLYLVETVWENNMIVNMNCNKLDVLKNSTQPVTYNSVADKSGQVIEISILDGFYNAYAISDKVFTTTK